MATPSATANFDYTRRFDATACIDDSPGRSENAPVILDEERKSILARRALKGRGADLAPTGLALSGGGIRSASFCLGVLQALDAVKIKHKPTQSAFDNVDYLSTVSGGGYIGCCLAACLHATKGIFPFNETDGNYGDPDAVRHVRDFSNYLVPRGSKDLFTSIGIIACGLAANACLVAPLIFLAALLLWAVYPTVESLECYGRLYTFVREVPIVPGLPLTSAMLALDLFYLILWALKRSAMQLPVPKQVENLASKEIDGPWVWIWRRLVNFSVLALWFDIQPIVLAALAKQDGLLTMSQSKAASFFDGALAKYLTLITPILSPVAGVIVFLSRNLNRAARPDREQRWLAFLRRFAAKAALLGAAIIVPSLIWLAYLELTLTLQQNGRPAVEIVVSLTLIAFFIALSLDPNLTSLHRLYRDRLAKAFLFSPDESLNQPSMSETAATTDRMPINPKIHELAPEHGPFPIINAALNLEGSAFANRRGRNADFFEFTPLFIGSEATGWRRSASMEDIERKLDLGTAMAISGPLFHRTWGQQPLRL